MKYLIGLHLLIGTFVTSAEDQRPNIVLLYADDLGFGDLGAYGATAISTPNMDRLAKEGLRFTNGHAPSATCTPSRYAMMTGEYAWRKKGTGVLPGDAAMIIEAGRTTMASVLQTNGYQTCAVGKWHLGLGVGNTDWNKPLSKTPLDIGFTHSFIMAATGDRVPCVYMRDREVVGLDPKDPIEVSYQKPFPGLPTGAANPELLKMHPSHGHDQAIVNGISRIGYMKGGTAALWKDEDMADTFTGEAVKFIDSSKDKPFFLYFALHDPHVPRVPHPRFVGKTKLGPRGDAIVQADWCIGEILNTLERLGLTEKTLVILSSDNGPVVDDGYKDDAVKLLGDHKPAGVLRGGKYSKFEGGTRVPFITRWPGKIKPGVSAALVSQVDFTHSFSGLIGKKFDAATAPDSLDLHRALLGEDVVGREYLIEHAGGLAIRTAQWKYIEQSNGQRKTKETNTELGNDSVGQLYDLLADPGEKNNVVKEHPEVVAKMKKELTKITGKNPPQ